MCTTFTIASKLYTVDVLVFISAGKTKRGWTRQYKVVRSKSITRELAGMAGRPSNWLSILLGRNDARNLLLNKQRFSECLDR